MSDRSNTIIQVVGAIAVALIGGAVAIWTQRPESVPAPRAEEQSAPTNRTPNLTGVMGQLEPGINRQGMDLSAIERHAPNPETCAEFCRTEDRCKAITYVFSLKTCWLKAAVPPPFPPGGADYVSAVKQ